MTVEWTYDLELVNDVRIYPGGEKEYGQAWQLVRVHRAEDGASHIQPIVASPFVFQSDREAKRDALEKLSILACPLDQPLAKVIKELLD